MVTKQLVAFGLAISILTAVTPAYAAVSNAVGLEGSLTTQAGIALSNGAYSLTFRVYAAASGGTLIWQEGPVVVTVNAGRFQYDLGTVTPLTADIISNGAWLSIQVAGDVELARTPWRAAPMALRASVAEGLACKGCVGAAEIDASLLALYAKVADLAVYAKLTDLANYVTQNALTLALSAYAKVSDLANYVKLTDLAAYTPTSSLSGVALSGKYSDLSGKPVLAVVGSACAPGKIVVGIAADGSLQCADPTPAVGLANTFGDGTAGPLDVAAGATVNLSDPAVVKTLSAGGNMQFSSINIAGTLYVPSGMILRSTSTISVTGSIMVNTWADPSVVPTGVGSRMASQGVGAIGVGYVAAIHMRNAGPLGGSPGQRLNTDATGGAGGGTLTMAAIGTIEVAQGAVIAANGTTAVAWCGGGDRPGPGGGAGGIISMISKKSITVAGKITANGGAGGEGCNDQPNGFGVLGGGGGGGGIIRLAAPAVATSGAVIQVTGGAAGKDNKDWPNKSQYGSGGGACGGNGGGGDVYANGAFAGSDGPIILLPMLSPENLAW